MGTYATTTSLQMILVGSSFDDSTNKLASKCIDWAESEVNKYLSKRYDLSSSTFQTSTSIPPTVRSLTEQIAEGFFYMRNSRGGKESITRGKECIALAKENLELISSYKADLFDTSGSLITDKSNTAYRVLCNTSDYSETFNEDDPLHWSVDTDKLDDIDTERD